MARNPKKHLSFQSLRQSMSSMFQAIPDQRQSGKVRHNLHDVLMSGFAMMFYQDPSLLEFQKRMTEAAETCNLKTLFGVESIPGDGAMRDTIDRVAPESFAPVFKEFLQRLQRGKHLEQYQFLPGMYLCALDGSEYFGSEKINCDGCLEQKRRNGTVKYSHQIVQAAIVHPEMKQVLPFMGEEVRNREGAKKQDCEINAADRLLRRIHEQHPRLGLIVTGDGLYSKKPQIDEVLRYKNMHYLFTAKPGDHKFMFEYIAEKRESGGLNRMETVDETGRRHVYEWLDQVPLGKFEHTSIVNYMHYEMIVPQRNGSEKTTYRNDWVTDLDINRENVAWLTRGGRARWKIENEYFNNLKNQGYCIEHNYGHGSRHLSFNFLVLTLLAFYMHQILELTDPLFVACREKFGSRRGTWERLRAKFNMVIFDDWEQFLNFTLNPRPFRLNSS